jgi:hypothetical protein
MRLLADSLEREFMTAEDRRGWISDLRGHAKGMERAAADADEPLFPCPHGKRVGLCSRCNKD